jgi:hypothetical protein
MRVIGPATEDDMVAAFLRAELGSSRFANQVRTSELRFSTEWPPPDPGWLRFLCSLGEIAKAGGDIRERVFGVPGLGGLE